MIYTNQDRRFYETRPSPPDKITSALNSADATAGWLLSPDSTGRYYLLSGAAVNNGGDGPPRLQDKGYNGRIDNGKFVNLPPSSGELFGQAW